MICRNCGYEIPEDSVSCKFCGAIWEEPTPVQIDGVGNPGEDYSQQNSFGLNTNGNVKKKSKKVPILIGIGVVVVALIVLIAVNFQKWFSSPTDPRTQLTNAFKSGISTTFENVSTVLADTGIISNKAVAGSGSVKLKINESLASGFGDSGESIIAILDNLSIDYQTTIDDGRNMVSMKVNYDGNTMMTGQFISDLETGEQWFSIPELNQKALYVSALDTLGDASAYMEMLSKLLESDRIKPIVIRYAELFVDGLTSVEQGTETVTVEGVSQKLTVLKCRLTQEDAKKMVENIFQSMKTDDDIKALILEIATAMNKDGNSLYSDFVDSLQDAIEEIQNQNTSDAGTDELNFEVLLSGKKLAGFRMDVSGTYGRVSGLSGKILIATVKDGDKFGYQMSFGSALELIGSGEDKGKNGVTGEFVLSATGMEALKIELENVVETEGAVSSGIIEISFGKDVLNVMDSEMGSQMGGMSMSLLNPKLKIEMNQDGKKGSGSISVVAMAMKMLEFTVEYEETAPVEIVIPKDYVNASDVDALRQWMEEAGIYDLLASVMGTTGQDDTFYY